MLISPCRSVVSGAFFKDMWSDLFILSMEFFVYYNVNAIVVDCIIAHCSVEHSAAVVMICLLVLLLILCC